MDARAGSAADRQRGDAPAKPAPAPRHHPDGGRSRRRPAGGRQCAILRLGAEEPRRADADAWRRSRRPAASSRKRAMRLKGIARDRLCGAGLLRAAAEEMHGRLGPAVLQHLAGRQDPALPRRRDHHRARIRIGALQSFDRLDLAELRSLQPLSRHRLDAGAVQELRIPGDRFRRLPLPGFCADRRCRQYRSGLHAVADARADLQAGRAARRRPTTTASSIAISPAARWRRTATMAPDADAGKSAATAPIRSRR